MSDFSGINIDFSQINFDDILSDGLLSSFTPPPVPATNSSSSREVSDLRGTNGSFRMSTVPKGDATGVDLTFIFPFLPSQMQISDLSDTYVEIGRPQLIPLVEFSTHKLMKFQIEFLVAAPGDGMRQSVDAEITFLRRMATSRQGIVFSNASNILINPLYYSGVLNTNNLFFYITDMSVNAMRFSPNNRSVSSATVNLSFTEVRNPVQRIVKLPAIKYTPKTPKKKGGGKTNDKNDDTLVTGDLPNGGLTPAQKKINAANKAKQIAKKIDDKAPKIRTKPPKKVGKK